MKLTHLNFHFPQYSYRYLYLYNLYKRILAIILMPLNCLWTITIRKYDLEDKNNSNKVVIFGILESWHICAYYLYYTLYDTME